MIPRDGRTGLLLMAVLLYGGPLLAGWMRAPWPIPAALAAMFFLAQLFAGKTAARGPMPLALYMVVLALTQAVLVVAIYALGAGLSTLTGVLALPPWLPLALTVVGTAIYAWRFPQDPKQDEVIGLLDQALESIEQGTPFDDGAPDEGDAVDPEVRVAGQQAIAALWELPSDTEAGALDRIVQRLEQKVGHRGFSELLREVDGGFPQVDRAFLRYLASPAVRRRLIEDGADLRFAFTLLLNSDNAGVRAELVALVNTLLEEGAPAGALPPAELLRQKAEEAPELKQLVAPVEHVARKGP